MSYAAESAKSAVIRDRASDRRSGAGDRASDHRSDALGLQLRSPVAPPGSVSKSGGKCPAGGGGPPAARGGGRPSATPSSSTASSAALAPPTRCFPDSCSHRLPITVVARPVVRERLRQVWLDPLALDPSWYSAKVTREIAARLTRLAGALEEASPGAQGRGPLTRPLSLHLLRRGDPRSSGLRPAPSAARRGRRAAVELAVLC